MRVEEAKPRSIFMDFLQEYAMRGKEKTLETYLYLLTPFERWLEEKGVREPDRKDVLAYLAERADWSNNTKNQFLSALRGWARWSRGYAEDGPTQARLSRIETIRGFPRGRDERKALTLDEIRILLAKAEPEDYALLWILLWFGLRVGELNLIRSVNLERGELVVETEKVGGTRTLFFDEYTGALLEYARSRGLLSLSPKVVWRRLVRYGYYIRPKHFTPHVCRHTFATHMAKVADRDLLRRMLGHSPRSTTDLYVHPSEEEVREVMLRKHYLKPLELGVNHGGA